MEPTKSPHILNSSTNLLGLCFIVLSSIRYLKLREESLIDEITGVAFVFFMSSCLFSFLELRSKSRRAAYYETIAEYSFLGGLLLVFAMTIMICFDMMP